MYEWVHRLRGYLYGLLEAISSLHPSLCLCDPANLENDLRRMTIRGEIAPEKYRGLAAKARKGELGRGDLELLRRQALRDLESQGRAALPLKNPAIEKTLDRLFGDRIALEDSQAAMERVLDALRKDLEGFTRRAEQARQNARLSLPDEGAARRYLELKQVWQERAGMLEMRIDALERETARLESLQAELAAFENGLRILDSREHLAALETGIRKGYLDE